MKKILLLFITFIITTSTFAQIDEVQLVVSGIADTKENAITTALRSAIEQAFGTFVSANTEIVNDELTKDEIVTISSGNIKKYEEISSILLPNNQHSVTLNAVVSVKKLTTFAQSHGSSCELAGNVFAENMRLKELNKRNEETAFKHLEKQLRILEENLFDISIRTGEPKVYDRYNNDDPFSYTPSYKYTSEDNNTYYSVPIRLVIKSTENSNSYLDLYFSTLNSLKLSEEEIEDYKKIGLPIYTRDVISFEEHNENYGIAINDGSGRPTKNKILYSGTFRSHKFIALRPYRQLENIFIKFNGITDSIYRDYPENKFYSGLYRRKQRGWLKQIERSTKGMHNDYTEIPINARSIDKFGKNKTVGTYLPILSIFNALYNHEIGRNNIAHEISAYYFLNENEPTIDLYNRTIYGKLVNFENRYRPYNDDIAYKNLSAYKTIESNINSKKKSRKKINIPKTGQWITSIEYEIIFTPEELSKLSGFEIIYK